MGQIWKMLKDYGKWVNEWQGMLCKSCGKIFFFHQWKKTAIFSSQNLIIDFMFVICNITFLLFFRLTSWWNYQIENRMKIQWSQKNIYHVVKTKLTYFITNIYRIITISIVIVDWDFVIFVFITTSKQSIHNVYLIMCYSKVG